MSTPSRYCSLPNRTVSGTTLTPSGSASEGEMSDVLSVTRWITSLEGEHVRIVLLTPGVDLELGGAVCGTQGADQRHRVGLRDVVAAVHRDQLGHDRFRREHRLDDAEIVVADLGDLVV